MMNEFIFRPARKSDCRAIAELYRVSSDGVADYIWTKIASPGEQILDVGQRRYEREDSVFSYRSCTVVELHGRVVGMLSAFPMHVDPQEEEDDPVLAPYARLEEDNSFYICGMALLPDCRGQGAGSYLLAHAARQARDGGYAKLSLIVFEQNTGAKRLYDRSGFREVGREPVVVHPLIHYTGDAVLMVRELQILPEARE